MLKYALQVTFLTCTLWLHGQQEFNIVWYNVENVFDTINTPNHRDGEYTPNGAKHWNSSTFWPKLNNIAKAIRNAPGFTPPAVIGLCEVENSEVVYQLSRRPALSAVDYRIVHYESEDIRGIDVAFLYDPSQIQMFSSAYVPIRFPDNPNKRTRGVLIASGQRTSNRDTLHFIGVHWPSRWGGVEHSEPSRIRAALVTGQVIDSLLTHQANARIVVMGDFNDGPEDESIQQLSGHGVTPLMLRLNPEMGSHKYRGRWEYLDQFLVSSRLASMHTDSLGVYVYMNEELLEDDRSHTGVKPKRSWRGHQFTFGYSDHLPIVLKLYQTQR